MNKAQKQLIAGFLKGNAGLYAEPYQTISEGCFTVLLAYGIEFAWNQGDCIRVESRCLTYDMEQAVKEIVKKAKVKVV